MAKHIWLRTRLTWNTQRRASKVCNRLCNEYGWDRHNAKRAVIWVMESIAQKGASPYSFAFREMQEGESAQDYMDYRFMHRADYLIKHTRERPWVLHTDWPAVYDRLISDWA